MRLSKTVLALAAVTLLASCGAKDITKAQAVEMAKGYDTANVIYKSGDGKLVSKATFSDNVPAEMRQAYKDGEQTQHIEGSEIVQNRVSAALIEAIPEDAAKFKANGKALEFTYTQAEEVLGQKVSHETFAKTDDNGYVVESKTTMNMEMLVSEGEVYKITVVATVTMTWTK